MQAGASLGNQPTQISPELGGSFTLFGGHIVGRHLELLPDTRIVYVSINPSVARWSEEDRVLEANRLIAGYVRENNGKAGKLSFIDTHSGLLSPEGKPRPEILRADGLHLNSQGYALWTALLKPQILRLAAMDTK